ncbi:NfeD family protein [Legionella micdadei]|uniref:Membrane bound peptidase NefD homolog n=3 Tax=Legionella micdadei TaxID=451 RepID=A0A098GLA7_LEGMI|nr:nodulation protein NfeD [Legionella micdadei]KTD28901.1 transmembrane protein [Legionella micdadei]NSL17112.1 nodulation protein NfeD [Legionella micdadei]CEG62281.1 membrane bound peptidase; NefD homolog [Legionella micdadei]SCY04920.1 membrane-bound serine protease (ClpP class) [Legionella micdadei]
MGVSNLRRLIMIIGLILLLTPFSWAGRIVELTVRGAIGPATADYLSRGINNAHNATLILITIDTPGGLDKSTRQIVQDILSSKVPVVVYVAPSGARAASAGTFLVYAGTVAAMAPSTHLGAASPVDIGSAMGGQSESTPKTTMEKKVTNDSIAYIRSLAQLRDRDPVFAEKAVQDAATMTADEAMHAKVINFIAKDRSDLLAQLNGKVVSQDGHKIKLKTEKAEIVSLPPDWRTRFLEVVTDPTVAYLLLLLGIYGIFFELVNPGYMLPGVVGAISFLIALYAFQLLPVNYAGLALIALGLAFIVGEAFAPSFGAFGIGGTIAFIMGSILLISTDSESYQIAWSAIGAMAVANLIILFALITMMIKTRKRKVQHGVEVLIGAQGRALGAIDTYGQAVIRGEIWSVHAKKPVAADKPIKVIAAEGLQLEVEEINAP